MKKKVMKKKIRDELIYDTIVELCLASGDKVVRPEDVAMALYKEDWQSLLKRVRLFAGKLAQDGTINIIRKGKIADPDDFKGVYRMAAADGAASYQPRMPEKKG